MKHWLNNPGLLVRAVAVGTLLIAGLIVVEAVPLGIPGEWTWPRIPYSWGHFESLLYAGLFAGLTFLYLWFGSFYLTTGKLVQEVCLVVGLALLGIIAPLWLCQSAPGLFGLQRAPLVLYYPMTSGYFLEAKRHPEPMTDYLKKYPAELKQGDYLHLGTHPPGLILLYRGLDQVCQDWPMVTQILQATEPNDLDIAFDFLEEQTAIQPELESKAHSASRKLLPLVQRDRCVLWLRMLVGTFLLATMIPAIYYMLKQEATPQIAWWLAGSSLFLPGVITFFPKSDTLYPACSVWIVFFTYQGLKLAQERYVLRFLCLMMAGVIQSLSLCFSLALLPIGLVVVMWILVLPWINQQQSTNDSPNSFYLLWACKVCFELFAFLAGCLLVIGIIWLSLEVNLLEIWRLNLQNHARFYDHNQRHYLGWLILNVFELILTLGIPLVIPWLWMLLNFKTAIPTFKEQSVMTSFSLGTMAIWGLLWLSGKNMGEAMRLWIFWTPLLVLISGYACTLALKQSSEKVQRFTLSMLVICQIIICLVTASRIDAFGFTNFFRT